MDRSQRQSLKLAAIYIGVAAAWIILSDRILVFVLPEAGSTLLARVQSLKGMAFVLATGGMLYWMVRRSLGREIESHRGYQDLVQLSPNGIYVHIDGIIQYINPAGVAFLGASSDKDIVGRNLLDFLHPDFHHIVRQRIAHLGATGQPAPPMEEKWLRVDGSEALAEVTAAPFRYQDRDAVQVILRDLTESRANAERMHYMVSHDALTGLPNMSLLKDRLEQELIHAQRLGRSAGLLVMNISGMRYVNDSYGYAAGDALLRAISSSLLAAVRPGDTVARVAGDEFAVLLSDLRDRSGLLTAIEKVRSAVTRPYLTAGQSVYVGVHSGAALWPDDGREADALINNAVACVQTAKRTGSNQTEFYTRDTREASRRRVTMEAALVEAITRQEFVLHYQPQVNAASGKICGCEALIRWNSPAMGLVPPGQFIPLAEETGLILDIGNWALREACRQMEQWRNQGLGTLQTAVNLSAVQLRNDGLEATLEALLKQHALTPSSLVLELTESMVMDKPAQDSVQRLQQTGVQLSLDDFGTGYSSFSSLKAFHMNHLKIDMSFVRDITANAGHARIAQAIITLGHGLDMEVVAEGVETAEQARLLEQEGCDVFQGYYFGRPMPADALAALLPRKFTWR